MFLRNNSEVLPDHMPGQSILQMIYYLSDFKNRYNIIFPAALGPGAYSASNRNEYQKQNIMFLGSKLRRVRRADNLTAIYEQIV
jgi:hypothetical protein